MAKFAFLIMLAVASVSCIIPNTVNNALAVDYK